MEFPRPEICYWDSSSTSVAALQYLVLSNQEGLGIVQNYFHMMPDIGPSRYFAAPQNLVAIRAIADIE
jgi:hypothetical protein